MPILTCAPTDFETAPGGPRQATARYTGPVTMKPTPQTLAEALDVIRAMHDELLAFRNPEFDLITPGCEGEFDDRVKAVLAHSAPVINADRAAALPEASSSTKSQSQGLSFDQTIEAQIQAKGKTAPRITPTDIEANIASEHYFTGAEGAASKYLLHQEGAADHPGEPPSEFSFERLGLLTFCVLVLRNGFTVTGESACASPENFDPEIGRNIARQNAVAKVWPLMGYELRSKLADKMECTCGPNEGCSSCPPRGIA